MIIWGSFISTPIGSIYYKLVDKVQIKGLLGLVVKVAIDQLLYAPFINIMYLFILTWLKTNDVKKAWNNVRPNIKKVMIATWKVWTIVAVLCYTYFTPNQ